MKVFISDLHLGDGSRTDDFHRDKELLQFLEFVENKAQELIIVGDFLELWQADLDRILFRHSEVIKKLLSLFNRGKVTYVIGNHDYIPFVKFSRPGFGITNEYHDPVFNLVAEHGHSYDIFNRYKNPLRSITWPAGKYFTFLLATLERLIHPNIDLWTKKVMERFDDFFQETVVVRNKVLPSTKEYIRRGGHFAEFTKAVKQHIHKGKRIVIFGHTHKAQLEKLDHGIYANCGTWVDGATPTYIACHQEAIELKEAISHHLIKEIGL